TRSRGGLVKLTVLALLVMLGFLLLLSSLYSSDAELQRLELRDQQLVGQAALHDQAPALLPLPPVMKTVAVEKASAIATATSVKASAHAVQQSEEPVDDELVKRLESELPEVDYDFWYRQAMPNHYGMDIDCARYPDPLELQLHNTYWQTFVNVNVTFRLYAAYWDTRQSEKLPGMRPAVVRVLATANQIGDAFPPTQCQFWYDNYSRPVVTNVSEFISVWVQSWASKPLQSYPHLLVCPLPEELPPTFETKVPRTVSLVSDACENASNSLRVHNDRRAAPQQESSSRTATNGTGRPLSFGVCVKGFDFPYVDLSERLIEWFEVQRLLGAERVYAYMYDVHPEVQRVMDYYERTGFLELRPLTMANGMPRLRHYQHMLLQQRLLVKRLNELIPYNDCFYRNMYRHDYLLNVDIDELVLPLGALRTWQEIFDADTQVSPNCVGKSVSVCFSNAYFTKVVPEAQNHEQLEADELYVLQHTMRDHHLAPTWKTKCFHNSRYALTLHNHFALKWLPGACGPHTVDPQLAHMQHYREPPNGYNVSELVEDRNAWKYATELRAAVEYVWQHLDDVDAQSAATPEGEDKLDDLREREAELEQAQEQQQVQEQQQAQLQ
ncbi:hypothetical protein KR222_005711, partial [Zaprionus bogoriensis]